MGRLLDIARTVPVEKKPTEKKRVEHESGAAAIRTGDGQGAQSQGGAVSAISAVSPPPVEDEAGYRLAAPDVLALLSGADAALPHTAIVKALMDLGHDKVAARDAVSECQRAGRIEHNLTTGYVLAGGTGEEVTP